MRIAIYTTAHGLNHGGGVLWALFIASALAKVHEVDFYMPVKPDESLLPSLFPGIHPLPKMRQAPISSTMWIIGEGRKAVHDLQYDAVGIQAGFVPRILPHRRSWLICEFPMAPRLALDDRLRLSTFRRIVTCSGYSAGWIRRRWNREADVLYPPVTTGGLGPKRPRILAVGRFLAGPRSKQQAEMVGMFKRLCERGLRDWELHLAGYGHDRDYVDRVRKMAEGLPVFLHLDTSRTELDELYATSSVFWHAAGAGVDETARPEHLEHFGMVTAEAMSWGCVPVVINRGGQPEAVGSAAAGILWNTFDECVETTFALANDSARRARMSEAAFSRAAQLSFPRFADATLAMFGS